MRLNTIYKPSARVTLKRLKTACNKLNDQLNLNNKAYSESGKPLETYQISAAYGGYRLEYWTGSGGACDQTHRTTAKELYLIIISILSGLQANDFK
jgi:hypothetical protein